MIIWLIKIHNNVNLMLNKRILNEEEFHQKYFKPCQSVNESFKSDHDYCVEDAVWTVLFSIALTYPNNPYNEEEFHYRLFITELLYILPESRFKKLIWQAFYQSPKNLDQSIRNGRPELYNFVYYLHRKVKQAQGKTFKYTNDQILEKYLCKI